MDKGDIIYPPLIFSQKKQQKNRKLLLCLTKNFIESIFFKEIKKIGNSLKAKTGIKFQNVYFFHIHVLEPLILLLDLWVTLILKPSL